MRYGVPSSSLPSPLKVGVKGGGGGNHLLLLICVPSSSLTWFLPGSAPQSQLELTTSSGVHADSVHDKPSTWQEEGREGAHPTHCLETYSEKPCSIIELEQGYIHNMYVRG